MYQLIQLRVLYKLAKIPADTRKRIKGINFGLLKMLAIVLTALHLCSISNFMWTPLNNLTE